MAHHLIPPQLAENPGAHGAAVGVVIGVMGHVLPTLAALAPIMYYGLLIADFIISKFNRKE